MNYLGMPRLVAAWAAAVMPWWNSESWIPQDLNGTGEEYSEDSEFQESKLPVV